MAGDGRLCGGGEGRGGEGRGGEGRGGEEGRGRGRERKMSLIVLLVVFPLWQIASLSSDIGWLDEQILGGAHDV